MSQSKSNRRIYVVRNTTDMKSRLIRAANSSQAVNYVTRDEYKCHVASQDDIVRLVAEGTKVEDVGGD